ncbi:MAG: hypothetical protein ACKVPX_13370 [Myxococcaceae bacterium]
MFGRGRGTKLRELLADAGHRCAHCQGLDQPSRLEGARRVIPVLETKGSAMQVPRGTGVQDALADDAQVPGSI